jgi:hypothetical protein
VRYGLAVDLPPADESHRAHAAATYITVAIEGSNRRGPDVAIRAFRCCLDTLSINSQFKMLGACRSGPKKFIAAYQ